VTTAAAAVDAKRRPNMIRRLRCGWSNTEIGESCCATDLLDSNQAVIRDECRAYLVWRRCFSPVFLTNLFSLSWRRGESNDTRLLILRNLLQTYERKNRTTRCMPASYVQNHVQRNRVLRRCSSTQVLRRLLYLYACFFGASIRCVPGPCSIQWKARATTFCRHGNSLGAFIGGSSLSRR